MYITCIIWKAELTSQLFKWDSSDLMCGSLAEWSNSGVLWLKLVFWKHQKQHGRTTIHDMLALSSQLLWWLEPVGICAFKGYLTFRMVTSAWCVYWYFNTNITNLKKYEATTDSKTTHHNTVRCPSPEHGIREPNLQSIFRACLDYPWLTFFCFTLKVLWI